jgi:heme O synthase-like polyprenyltransferase
LADLGPAAGFRREEYLTGGALPEWRAVADFAKIGTAMLSPITTIVIIVAALVVAGGFYLAGEVVKEKNENIGRAIEFFTVSVLGLFLIIFVGTAINQTDFDFRR